MEEHNVDVLVVGLGVAGFSAAVAASEEGKKVLIVEKNNGLGGNAIQSNVGTICGAFYNGKSDSLMPIEHPFLQCVVEAVGAEPIKNDQHLVIVPYNLKVFENYMKSELDNRKVEILYNASMSSVEFQNDHLNSVELIINKRRVKVVAKSYVDCSGNGIISQLGGLEMISSSDYQSASQVFRLQNVSATSEYSLNFSIAKTIIKLVKESKLTENSLSLSVVPGSLAKNGVDLKFALPHTITDKSSMDELNKYGEEQANQLYTIIKANVESFKNSELKLIYPKVGIRVQQRSKGLHILTEEEVTSCYKSEEEAGRGSWPIEEWRDGRVNLTRLNGEYYSIPKSCLKSYRLKNLFFGGKNISATDKAIASARVIGTCLQTGYSAGKLAADLCQ